MGDLTNRECKVRAELKQVWMMSGQCGLLVEVTDLMLKEEEPQRCGMKAMTEPRRPVMAAGSQLLPLRDNRLQSVLLTRPNGQLTRAGQFYHSITGRRPPSRQFDESQPLIRDGPNDYILTRGGARKLVRSLQPNGQYHVTKLGKAFFKDKFTEWLAHIDHVIPVAQSFSGQQQELQAPAAGLPAAEVGRRPPLPGHRRVPLPKERPANARFPLPVFCPLDCIVPTEEGQLADLMWVEMPCDHRKGVVDRLPYVGRGWYAKPVCAYLLEAGLAQWQHFKWSLDATAQVDQRCLELVLERMEQNWPEGEEHYAKLAINSLVGLFARNLELIYSMKTSNHQVDGEGCSWRQTFTDAAGGTHWDHVFVTELLSNSSYRPVHDYIMGAEYVAVARIRQALAEVPRRYLKCIKTDCLVMQDVPKKYRPAVERLLQMSHRDGTPVYRYEEVTGLKGQHREPSMEAEPIRAKPPWRRVEDPVGHCLDGESLLLTGFPGTGKTHLAKRIVEALREHGDTVHIITKTHAAVQNVGLGAQTADHWVRRNVRSGHCSATWLVIEELTQLELKDSQLLHDLAGGWCHELSERWRFDERIFEFLTWLRVDEPEQVPLPAAVREARRRFPRRGEPDVSLVISHAKRLQINDRENRRLAPADALVVPYEARGAVPTNAPQTMRVWPGLRLIGAGGKVQKGTFLTVEAVEGDLVRLESRQCFAGQELLKHTRLCSAITYASVQGLTLRGRVWLYDVESPHFSIKHLYMGCSRATSSELLSVL
ncbi:hypothetical protein AK812_SmicGene44442 [Symbiodinium microadriaticum]|uniref:Uncharacterized protein n=1 Tax=Symbiodinium microadriaticum TaxID=2951 RepID=A0A1Q9BYF8_SYMMI|nr:hypothetical protein AK812_SmicGene44442 [Symbiodinium microadriaticum]